MKIKSMLIASAASLFTVSGALAADAIVTVDPEPAEYVQICEAFEGFYMIPGSEVCLDISGEVAVKYGYNIINNGTNTATFEVDYKISFDARHETDLGTVRSFIQVAETGDGILARGNQVDIDQAFISVQPNDVATLTMGLTGSAYDGESYLTSLAFASSGFTGSIGYEDRTVGAGFGLGGVDDAIVATLGYSASGFSLSGALAYEVREGNTYAANIGAGYAADRYSIALNYEWFRGTSNFEAVGQGTDELSVDLGLTLTDKWSFGSNVDIYFNANSWAVENTLTYAVSSNFSVAAELDYNNTNRNYHLGLDFVASF